MAGLFPFHDFRGWLNVQYQVTNCLTFLLYCSALARRCALYELLPFLCFVRTHLTTITIPVTTRLVVVSGRVCPCGVNCVCTITKSNSPGLEEAEKSSKEPCRIAYEAWHCLRGYCDWLRVYVCMYVHIHIRTDGGWMDGHCRCMYVFAWMDGHCRQVSCRWRHNVKNFTQRWVSLRFV